MYAEGWIPPSGSGRVLSPEELNALLADATDLSALDPRRGPLPAVLDTDFIRTGLHSQLKEGTPARSVRSAQQNSGMFRGQRFGTHRERRPGSAVHVTVVRIPVISSGAFGKRTGIMRRAGEANVSVYRP